MRRTHTSAVQDLKDPDRTSDGVLVGSGRLAAGLDRLDLIDEYKFLVQSESPATVPPSTRVFSTARAASS
ncbi:hypothetical protein [Arthrobacter jiangjiafuii]|uniref:hypothetical protein n=1 Tax=Arthrobacter jiangjiafuii TaxID=2817475 RepID=UPI001F256453|nr:hypothetical protein [Arthrobacter jiangjiafuii]